jgi:p24 family protein beta-1
MWYEYATPSSDHSFTAQTDGKYIYCFSNENWMSNSKEVSFNVHGIVYVPESELEQDPLEVEGMGRSGRGLRYSSLSYQSLGLVN